MNGTESLVRRRCIIVLRRICQINCTSIVIYYIFTSPLVIVAPLTMRASHDDARWMCVDALRRERGESERPSDSRGERSRVRRDGFRLDASERRGADFARNDAR